MGYSAHPRMSSSDDIVDVCVQSTPSFDDICYQFWLDGLTPSQSSRKIKPTSSPLQFHRPRQSEERKAIALHVSDQHRNFDILEHSICQPDLLVTQQILAVPKEKIAFIVEQYYALDDNVVREIVGKQKLTKSRKDLEEIATSTGCSLKSVTRQFDNLKRVFTQTEEIAGNVQIFARERFLMPIELARKYACLVFLVSGGFTLGTKRRITRISCAGLERCAALTMACLVSDLGTFCVCCARDRDPPRPASTGEGEDQIDVRPLGESEEEVWRAVCRCVGVVPNAEGVDKQLQHSLSRVRVVVSQHGSELGLANVRANLRNMDALMLQGRFKPVVREVLRDLINIGSQLSQTREYRDFYEDILSKVGEPLEEAGLTLSEIDDFLVACCYFLDFAPDDTYRERRTSSVESNRLSERTLTTQVISPSIRSHWIRFLECCRLCLMQLLQS